MLALSELLARFSPATKRGKEYRTRCPAHPDTIPSLDIMEGHTGYVFLCRSAGCATRDILTAAGLAWADVLPARATPTPNGFAAIYDYRDASGVLRYQVVRKATSPGTPKQFVQRHPDGAGGWVWKMEGIARLPYHLHELAGHTLVYVPEGEKDVDRLWALGLPATCNTGGAKKWRDSESAALKAVGIQRVILLPDNDAEGAAHVLSVAQSLDRIGLLHLTLPAFPVAPKGDVSDWLDAGHTRADLEALCLQPATARELIELTGLTAMLHEPEDLTTWIVEDRIPAGSVCLLVAKPKVGKTTTARHLAVAVARGESWLGSACAQGRVWYMAFEGRKADHLSHFRQFQLTDDEASHIWCYIDAPTPTILAEMRARAAVDKPSLIIVDTLQRLLQVKSMDDYAEVTKAFDALIALVRQTGTALLLLHHAGKATDRDPLDSVLGSTAIAGSVDNTMVLSKLSGFRTVTTRQRIGPDFDERVIRLLPTGGVVLGELREQAEKTALMNKMETALANAPSRLTTTEWLDLVEARKQAKLAAIRQLVSENRVLCTGKGKRENPFIYTVPGTAPVVPKGPEPNQDDIFSV